MASLWNSSRCRVDRVISGTGDSLTPGERSQRRMTRRIVGPICSSRVGAQRHEGC